MYLGLLNVEFEPWISKMGFKDASKPYNIVENSGKNIFKTSFEIMSTFKIFVKLVS